MFLQHVKLINFEGFFPHQLQFILYIYCYQTLNVFHQYIFQV